MPEYVSAATYSIEDLDRAQSDSARVIASGAATVPSFTLTLDAASGPEEADATLVQVAATAGPSIGDHCVVIAADGAFEAFEVEAISSNAYVRARSWLAGTYASSDTVRGVTITAPVSSALYNLEAALDDQRPLRVVWQYTLASGAIKRVSEIIELSRGNVAAWDTGPALATLRLGWPDLGGRVLQGLTLEALAEYSSKVLRAEFIRRCIPHHDLMLGEPGQMLLVACMLSEAAKRGYSPGTRLLSDFAAEAANDFASEVEALTIGTQGAQSTQMDTEEVSSGRASPEYWGPILAQ